ncbi:hypothetical protein B1R32_103245 [Abditibacterium utsteinense]|uniref:Uncharacterized protein n=1 Tax=Abditibacterium utsteinense TaxID=1960156 RepID=A0A2S8SW08_9BACT|nr:hypothetical protein [Abditibacterium utsteinense]PQV64975.1 hypothetical protein B1R32_103245 [Abditibacterium utsteinense]
MELKKWATLGLAGALLISYNLGQSDLVALRSNEAKYPGTSKREAYGPSLEWLDRLARASQDKDNTRVKLDFSVMSSLMVAGLASGFKSQVANLLWMKSDEYWHQGLFTRQVPIMEAVVTLDPQFVDAWSTAGWHWAYNIYADIPTNEDYKKKGPKAVAAAQENAVLTGLDYLKRGANMNPDTYRLWFEWGWTRAEKAGYYDEETLSHYKEARSKSDAREVEQTQANGTTKKVQGLDVLGRTIGHLYERIPDFPEALNHYAGDLMKATPAQRAQLDAAGAYWRRYGSNYDAISSIYTSGDATTQAQIKKLVPDVEQLVAAQATRQKIAGEPGKDQPVGAYISISARYMPAWKLMQAGNLKAAIADMVGVMNADPKYTMKGLPVIAQIYELRGDAPAAVEAQLKTLRDAEKQSSQDLGLHFLAKLYEAAAQKAQKTANSKDLKAYHRLAYETWYRSRERDALDFYALRKTRDYEVKYGYTAPANIIKSIKDSRKGGSPNAAPAVPPNVSGYYS